MYHYFYKNIKQNNCFQIIRTIITCAPIIIAIIAANQHIRIISEGSCDAENSALHHRNKLHFKIENINIFLNITVSTIFVID